MAHIRDKVTLELGEKIAGLIDDADLSGTETLLVLASVIGAAIDSRSDSLATAEAMLHSLYRTVRTTLTELDHESKLAYQTPQTTF